MLFEVICFVLACSNLALCTPLSTKIDSEYHLHVAHVVCHVRVWVLEARPAPEHALAWMAFQEAMKTLSHPARCRSQHMSHRECWLPQLATVVGLYFLGRLVSTFRSSNSQCCGSPTWLFCSTFLGGCGELSDPPWIGQAPTEPKQRSLQRAIPSFMASRCGTGSGR